MTSEGGGSVAFPIMTLAFSIPPSVARDFSLGIQSCGMTAAAFTIFWMRVQIEWHSVLFSSVGGAFGVIFGLEWIDPRLTPPQKKMGFVSVWFSFAFALFLLNRYHKRRTFKTIPDVKPWKCVVLFVTGMLWSFLAIEYFFGHVLVLIMVWAANKDIPNVRKETETEKYRSSQKDGGHLAVLLHTFCFPRNIRQLQSRNFSL